MKAVITSGYGAVDRLTVNEVEKPIINDDEILVRVHACSVNPIDWKIRSGQMKMISGSKPPKILGGDFSGVVDAVGENTHEFKLGDEVWGHVSALKGGSYAEYIKVTAENLCLKPKNFDFIQAASIPLAGLTAYQTLVNFGGIKTKDEVLINGCAGGVGSIAVQLAKSLGCRVSGVCSTKNIEYAKSIGVDTVIDYKQSDVLQLDTQFNAVFDFVGNLSFSKAKHIMANKARFVTAVPTMAILLFGGFLNLFRSKTCKGMFVKTSNSDLQILKDMAESDALKATIAHKLPLEHVREAHSISESGRVVGKIVMSV